jgi:DNA-3-methyladenine glycosylase II
MLTSVQRNYQNSPMKANTPRVLTTRALARGVSFLTKRDADLDAVVRRFGPPPLWERETGFHTLVHIILEQQVSLASAKAAYDRLLAISSPLTPSGLLAIDDAALKVAGFSRQKIAYSKGLARSLNDGSVSLLALEKMTDDDARSAMLKIKGVGHWTADIYLLMALRRPDIWPVGDLALAIATQKVKRLRARPTQERLLKMSMQWRPWRAVAARVMWHHYLSELEIRRSTRSSPTVKKTTG